MDEVDKIANRIHREYSRQRQRGNTDTMLLEILIDDGVRQSGFIAENIATAHGNIKKALIKKIQGKK